MKLSCNALTQCRLTTYCSMYLVWLSSSTPVEQSRFLLLQLRFVNPLTSREINLCFPQVPLSAFLFLVPMFAGPVARHSISINVVRFAKSCCVIHPRQMPNIRKVGSLGIVALGILFYRLHSEVQTSPSPKLLGIQSSHTSPVYSINIQEDDIFDAAQFNEGKQ